MFMKKVLLLLNICVLSICGTAQQIITFQDGMVNVHSKNPVEQKELAKAGMEFVFDFRYLKDTNDITETKDLMILQVTYGMSKFWSYRSLQVDSLIRTATLDQVRANPKRYSGGETWTIYKNYPQGKFTVTDKISRDWFLYEEDVPEQEWTLDDVETKEILGYRCRRAECDFRGRHYIAWYSDSIPVADGPWKFSGLPGFILEVYDSGEQYKFTLVGITPKATRAITMPDEQYNRTTRGRYYTTKRKFDLDPIGYLTSSNSGISITVTNPDGTPRANATQPRELKYDYIERDYRR
jgi:GLPGLI family protein